MFKRYLPYILLALAGWFLYFIQTHQRGHLPAPMVKDTVTYNIPATIAAAPDSVNEGFNRHATTIIYSKHAHCRMDCRHITEAEVKEILLDGKVNERKIEEDDRGTTYPLEGIADGHHLRIVFAPKENDAVEVVTCIDLDTDWPCDCK
jgi:hypothetical protein